MKISEVELIEGSMSVGIYEGAAVIQNVLKKELLLRQDVEQAFRKAAATIKEISNYNIDTDDREFDGDDEYEMCDFDSLSTEELIKLSNALREAFFTRTIDYNWEAVGRYICILETAFVLMQKATENLQELTLKSQSVP